MYPPTQSVNRFTRVLDFRYGNMCILFSVLIKPGNENTPVCVECTNIQFGREDLMLTFSCISFFMFFTIFHVYFYPYFDMAMGFIDLVVYGVITK